MILGKKMIDLINDDCMNVMKKYKDHYFDLAIVDPPYQLGTKNSYQGCGVLKNRKYNKDDQMKEWDIAPKKEYFKELQRVSKNQIIWGGNYFVEHLQNFRCFIFYAFLFYHIYNSMFNTDYVYGFRLFIPLFSFSESGCSLII